MGQTSGTVTRRRPRRRFAVWLFLGGLTLAWQVVCSRGPSDPGDRNDAGFLFRVAAGQFEAKIRYVILTVTGEGMNPIHKELLLEGTAFEGRVEVPAGEDRIFTCLAYDDSHRVIFSASDTVDLVPGEPFLVELDLTPSFFSLLLSPSDTTVSRGGTLAMRVQIYGVEDLFGATLRLAFDPDSLEVVKVEQGPFLGRQTLFFSKVDTSVVILGVTRKQGEAGVSGSGRLGTVYFRPRVAGVTGVDILESWIRLIKPDGGNVSGLDSLRVGASRLTVR